MKIYPGLHDLTVANHIDTENDVQLAYIDNKTYRQKATMSSGHNTSSFTPIAPYTVFDVDSPFGLILFDRNKNQIDADTKVDILNRTDQDKFMYIPAEGITFNPQEFTYRLVGKRTGKYNPSKDYNMSVKCINEYNDPNNAATEYSLPNQLIKIFGDAPSRQICPNNIWVNGGDISINSLYSTDEAPYIDFGFIKSPDGISYNIYDGDNLLTGTSNILEDELLKNFLALWIVVDDENFITVNENKTLKTIDSLYDYVIEDKNLYSDIVLNANLKVVEKSALSSTDATLAKSLFSPIVLRHDETSRRYIIYSPASLIEDINNNAPLIYEILVKIYLMGYMKTSEYNMWIADTVPDYILVNHHMVVQSQFISGSSYYDIFKYAKNDVFLIDVVTSAPNISISGLTADDKIIFNKNISGLNAIYKDPDKPSGYISIYCHDKTIMYYQNIVYTITTDIKDALTYSLHKKTLYISLNNFINSFNAIYIQHFSDDYTINSNIDSNILLVCKNNIINIVDQKDYDGDGLILCIFHVNFSVDESYNINDIRLRGGGLPEGTKHDVQSLFDIGAVEGMSYRAGGSIIIKIPQTLRAYEEHIKSAVKKHVAAEEYPFIILY